MVSYIYIYIWHFCSSDAAQWVGHSARPRSVILLRSPMAPRMEVSFVAIVVARLAIYAAIRGSGDHAALGQLVTSLCGSLAFVILLFLHRRRAPKPQTPRPSPTRPEQHRLVTGAVCCFSGFEACWSFLPGAVAHTIPCTWRTAREATHQAGELLQYEASGYAWQAACHGIGFICTHGLASLPLYEAALLAAKSVLWSNKRRLWGYFDPDFIYFHGFTEKVHDLFT